MPLHVNMPMDHSRGFGRQSTTFTGRVWIHLIVLFACLFSLGSGSGRAQEKKAALSKPEYGVVIAKDVMAPMRDGVRLATDIYFPAMDGKTVEGKWPTILQRTIYDKSSVEYANPEYFCKRGYVVVLMDCRGRFSSEGEYYHFIDEAEDGYDTCEWIGKQSWSDGKIGTYGPGFPFWPSWSVYDSRLPAAMQRFSHCCQVRYSFRCRSGLRMLADHGVPAKPEGPLATPLPRRPSVTRVRWLFRAVDVTLRAQVAPKFAAACRRTTSGSDAPPQAATNNIARASRAVRPSSSADAASSSATSF